MARDFPTLLSGVVALVGMMGAGKSTVGRRLATLLEVPFVDLDRLVEARAGASITDLIANGQEALFREWESRCLSEVLGGSSVQVLATGGGATESAYNRQRLVASARVIWIDAEPEILYQRSKDGPRPLALSGPRSFQERYARRRPSYREVSSVRFDTTGTGPEETAKQIERWLRKETEDDDK